MKMAIVVSLLGVSVLAFIGGLLFDDFKVLTREEKIQGIGTMAFTFFIIFITGLLNR